MILLHFKLVKGLNMASGKVLRYPAYCLKHYYRLVSFYFVSLLGKNYSLKLLHILITSLKWSQCASMKFQSIGLKHGSEADV